MKKISTSLLHTVGRLGSSKQRYAYEFIQHYLYPIFRKEYTILGNNCFFPITLTIMDYSFDWFVIV